MRLYLLQLGLVAPDDVPIQGYLIQADDGTNVLVDTGYSRGLVGAREQAAAASLATLPDGEMRAFGERFVAGIIRRLRTDADDLVVNRLAALGLAPRDITYLVCTHFDWDHAGNHDLFPEAELVVQRRHYEAARESPRLRLFGAPWDTPGLRYRMVEGDTELLPGIDLIESGGHVPGHQSVLVRLPETGPVLLAGDAIYGRARLDPQAPDGLSNMDHEGARASVRKLTGLAEHEGATLIVLAHDADQWRTLRKSPEFYA
jgi:N-acyl homoserine lactone hydrolase